MTRAAPRAASSQAIGAQPLPGLSPLPDVHGLTGSWHRETPGPSGAKTIFQCISLECDVRSVPALSDACVQPFHEAFTASADQSRSG